MRVTAHSSAGRLVGLLAGLFRVKRGISLQLSAPMPIVRGIPAVFSVFVKAALSGQPVAFPFPPGAPPLTGRAWWSAGSPKVDDGALDKLGVRCEVASWAEAGSLAAVNGAMMQALFSFQCDQTIVGVYDRLPALWGAVSARAAVAAYQTLWIAGAIRLGATDEQIATARAGIQDWFEETDERAEAGDLYLFHLFGNALSATADRLQKEIDRLQANMPRFKKTEERDAYQLAIARNQSASGEIRRILKDWNARDPLAQLPALGVPTALPLDSIVESAHSDGLQHWLIREVLRKVGSSAAEPIAIWVGDEWGKPPHASSRDDSGGWRRMVFVVRFFRHWLLNRPGDDVLLRRMPFSVAKAFFAPWLRLLAAEEQLAWSRPSGDQYELFRSELAQLRALELADGHPDVTGESEMQRLMERLMIAATGPVTAAEFASWGSDRIEYFQDSAELLAGAAHDSDEAWRRRDELLRFYTLWGEVTASAEEVRATVPDPSGVAGRYIAFFTPWVQLRKAFYDSQGDPGPRRIPPTVRAHAGPGRTED